MDTSQGQTLREEEDAELQLQYKPLLIKREKVGGTYYCRLTRAASWKTLGLSLSQSSDTLMAGSGHSPMISSPRFLLSSTRLHMTPRKDTEETVVVGYTYVAVLLINIKATI